MTCRTARVAGAALATLALLAAAACGGGDAPGGTAATGTADPYVDDARAALQAGFAGAASRPPDTAPAPRTGQDLWIVSCGQASQGCATPTGAAQEAATALGWKVTVVDGNFGIGDAYNAGLRNAVAAGADAIITVAVDCNQAKAGYQAARTAGVLVVGADSFGCSDPTVNAGDDLMSAVVSPNTDTPDPAALHRARGRAKADWIIARTDGRAKVINTAFQGIAAGRYENEGFVDELGRCTGCTFVQTIDYSAADTANGTLKQVFSTALAQHPDATAAVVISDGIVVQNNMAQALRSAGLAASLALVGGEAFAPNADLIRNGGGQAAAVPFDSAWMGWGAVDTVIRLQAGEQPVPQGFGIQVVDKDHNLPAAGESYRSPVDYPTAYRTAWGLVTS